MLLCNRRAVAQVDHANFWWHAGRRECRIRSVAMRVPQRGRAILRRLSPHEPVQAFRPGDFVLTASDGGLARTLGWASGSAINHAGLIVDPLGSVIEANPELLSGGRLYRLTTISDYLNAGQPCWIGYVELREGTRQEVVDCAEHLLHEHGPAWSPGS